MANQHNPNYGMYQIQLTPAQIAALQQQKRRLSYATPGGEIVQVSDVSQVPAGCQVIVQPDSNDTAACLAENPSDCDSLHVWRKQLQSSFCLLSPAVRKQITDRKLIWELGVIYSTLFMAGAQTEFFKSDNVKARGILNVANAKLDAGTHFVAFQLRLGSANAASTGTNLATLEYFNVEDTTPTAGAKLVRSALSPVVKNSELIIRANSVDVIKEIPGNMFDNFYGDQVGLLNLPVPIHFSGETEFSVNLLTNPGVTVPATLAVRLEMIGLRLMPNYLNA